VLKEIQNPTKNSFVGKEETDDKTGQCKKHTAQQMNLHASLSLY
jgi:hypothetical protein